MCPAGRSGVFLRWVPLSSMPLLEPTAADLAELRPIAGRAALVIAALADRPFLASTSDLTLSAAAGTGAAVASATRRVLVSWGWIEDAVGSPHLPLVSPERLLALSHHLRGISDAAALDEGPPVVEAVVTVPSPGGALRAVLDGRLDAHSTRDGFGHVAASAHNRLVFLVPFVDSSGAEALVGMLAATPAAERMVVVRPDSRGSRWYRPHLPPHLPALYSAGVRVVEYWRPPQSGVPHEFKARNLPRQGGPR